MNYVTPISNNHYYVRKTLVNKINSPLITIEDSFFVEFYVVKTNDKLIDRYKKIYYITKNEKLKHILDIINVCEFDRYNWYDISKEEKNTIIKDVIKIR